MMEIMRIRIRAKNSKDAISTFKHYYPEHTRNIKCKLEGYDALNHKVYDVKGYLLKKYMH